MGINLKKLANWKVAFLLMGSAGLMIAFQNCAQSGFSDEQDVSSLDYVDPKLAGLPFPYDVSVNQLAYMSCPSPSLGANSQGPLSAVFTFKAGAYDNTSAPTNVLGIKEAGLKLNSSYITAFDTATKNYTASLKTAKFKEALMTIPAAKNAQLQLAIRDPQVGTKISVFGIGDSGAPQTATVMSKLSSDAIADAFTKNKNKVYNEFPMAGTVSERVLTGSLTYPVKGGPTYDQYFRTDVMNRYLVLGFVNPDSMTTNGTPAAFTPDAKNNNRMYGTGFQLRFSRPTLPLPISLPSYPQRALSSVQEFDMSTSPPTAVNANWDCSLQFKIVKYDDRNKAIYYGATAQQAHFACRPETAAMQNTTANRAILHVMRRFLPAEAWDINVTDRCIVPRNPNNFCYGSSTSPVVYDEYFFANPGQGQAGNCGTTTTNDCAHYMTLCLRK